MDHGKLDIVDTPLNLIRDLGAFAVDEFQADGQINSSFYRTRDEAIRYLTGLGSDAAATLRNSTLEDVFVERIGSRLMKR